MTPSFFQILLLGSVAGFTIYLGLPFALVRSKTIRTFANALSVGILIFILIEILEKSFDTVKGKILLPFAHGGDWGDAILYIFLLVAGVAGAYIGLILFEKKWLGGSEEERKQPATLALIIAIGIGLHNFSEGLAIGQELAGGAMALGFILVVGFALHNATEGFGIASPLTGERPRIGFLFLLGLIGGGPTLLGTLVGESATMPILEIFFLALASGAILYVIGELTHIGRTKGDHMTLAAGILAGLFIAFSSEVLIDAAQARMAATATPVAQQVTLVAKDEALTPRGILLKANKAARLVIRNVDSRDHEIEWKTFGIEREVESGDTISFVITPQKTGKDFLLLDPDNPGRRIKTDVTVSP